MSSKIFYPVLILAILGIGGSGYLFWQNDLQKKSISEINTSLLSTESDLALKEEENKILTETLERKANELQELEDEVGDISKTVGTLDKLSKTDKELLQKYSKVYFLNENYVPRGLKDIPEEYKVTKNKELQIAKDVYPFLIDMLEAAEKKDIDLKIASAFRSFYAQASLKSSYSVTYGSGANKFSADQGYSEHQLGTTLDFTVSPISPGLTGFEKTEAYKWLQDNAYKYGFVLSYPSGNKYYVFEPWHWRFVGKDLADRLHDENKNFYDLDQREIDKYLVSLFD